MKTPAWFKPLVSVFVVAGALVAITKWPRGSQDAPSLSFPENPARIEISRSGERVVLTKAGDVWNLAEPVVWPADPVPAASLVSSLKALSMGGVLTRRAESHARYEVDDASGVRVSVSGGREPFSVVFGKTAPDFTHVYARLEGSPEVYLAGGIRRSDLTRSVPDWRDKRIAALPAGDDITAVSVSAGRTAYVLARDTEGWTVDGALADEAEINRLVAMLRNLNAEGFIDPPASSDLKAAGLDVPARTLSIKTSGGSEIRLALGKAVDNRVAVKKDGNDTLFLVSSETLADIPESASPFRAKAAQ